MTDSPPRLVTCDDCDAPLGSPASGPPVARPGLPAPRRCPACRNRWLTDRNARLAATYAAGAPGPRPSAAAGPDARATHAAVCVACRRAIRLPFSPAPDRPVYCRPCLAAAQGR